MAWRGEKANPISLRMSFSAGLKDLFRRIKNEAPTTDSGKVRTDGDATFWGISTEPLEKTTDWTVESPTSAVVNPGWSEEQLNVGFEAFHLAVEEGVVWARKTFDQEIYQAVYGNVPLEVTIMHGKLKEKPWGRVSANEVWEKYGSKLKTGEIPLLMQKEGYGSYESMLTVGAGKECGMVGLVSDDRDLRRQWFANISVGLDKHWSETLVGAVFSKNVHDPWKNLDNNRGILPIEGVGAIKSLEEFRLGSEYPSKRILIAGDLGYVGRVNPKLVGQIVAAGREGYKSGDVGVVAMMGVSDYEAWQRSAHRYWSRALSGAAVVTGGFFDYDSAERVARAFSKPYGRSNNPDMARALMGLEKTAVAALMSPDQFVEGWLLS